MCDCENGIVPDDEGSDALGFENDLWASANAMRGNMDASEYKHVVLPLVFLKYISDSFEDLHASLVSRGRNAENRDEYIAKGIFWVPQKARWSALVQQANDPSIGILIDEAMEAIEAMAAIEATEAIETIGAIEAIVHSRILLLFAYFL